MKFLLRCAVAVWMISPTTPLFAEDGVKITPDVVYGHKDGMALTFDLLAPQRPNGAALLFLRSGTWYSIWSEPREMLADMKPFLDKGFAVCIVRHGSAPKYTVPEAVDDVRLCVRFIHMKGANLGIDANRLGVCGESAGGHLTLMLATTGDRGDPSAEDEILRHSSRIAVGVAVCPPTDLRKWTTDPPPEIANLPGIKPPLTFDSKLEDDVSPVLHVTSDDAPVLLIHGDQDLIVPIQHSRNMLSAFEREKVASQLFVAQGAGHGFSPTRKEKMIRPEILRWFENHLLDRPIP